MSERSDAIGFASARRGFPPPNSSASALPMNDQVMASTSPRIASVTLCQAGAFLDQRQNRLGHGCFEPRQRLRLDAVETDDPDDLLDEIRLALDIGTPRRRRHVDRVTGPLNRKTEFFENAFRFCGLHWQSGQTRNLGPGERHDTFFSRHLSGQDDLACLTAADGHHHAGGKIEARKRKRGIDAALEAIARIGDDAELAARIARCSADPRERIR